MNKRKRRVKKDNRGFSLVELLITVALLSIVSAAIFEFVIVASRHYQKGAQEVEVQYEAQLVMNQLQDFLIDAKKGVAYTANGSSEMILSDAAITGETVTGKQLKIYDTDRYYIIEWKADEQKLFYTEYEKDAEGSWTTVVSSALMAEYVAQFSVDLSQTEQSNSVRLNVLFQNDREYRVTQNVTLRNKVLVNKTLSEMYDT